jgi:hypothetical protein
MIPFIGPGDPPIFVFSYWPDTPPINHTHMSHHPRYGLYVKQRYDELGLRCETYGVNESVAKQTNVKGKTLGYSKMIAFFESVLATSERNQGLARQ